MSKEKRRVPKLRFPEFTEDWEQCKLGEIFEYLQNNTLSRDSLNYKIPNIKNIHYGDILVKFNEILDGSNKDIPYINPDLDLSKFSKSLLRDGDVIFSDTAEDDTVGKAIELQNVNAPFILSGLHTIPCRPLIPFGKGYLGNFFNSNSYRLQIRPLVQGIKVSSISKSALKDTMIKYPKNLDEQEKIGSLFQSITKMITLHQRKLDNLKLKKKALLQKLFPKNGERYPELRFPEFTDAWEQRKADYIFKSVTEKGYPELPVLSASQELGMVYRDQNGIDIQHDKKNESSYKRVSPGQFVIHLRSFQGGFAYSEVEGITSPAYTVMSFKNSSEQYGLFWKYVFKSETFIKRLETITYGIRDGRSISFSDFKSLMLQYPSLSEQELIGDLIAIIESGITLHQ